MSHRDSWSKVTSTWLDDNMILAYCTSHSNLFNHHLQTGVFESGQLLWFLQAVKQSC